MKQFSLFAIALLLISGGCSGQKSQKSNESDTIAKNQPETYISVNKEYDKDGNIIGYDSTYSSYYSNIKDNFFKRDSVFDLFKKQFNTTYSFSDQPYFKDLFFEDSLLKYDFYKKDFFSNRFRRNMRKMDSLFMKMDMMKNDFFDHQFKEDGDKEQKSR